MWLALSGEHSAQSPLRRFRSNRFVGFDHIDCRSRFAQFARNHIARNLRAHQQHALALSPADAATATTDSATYSFGVTVTVNPCFSIALFVAGPIAAIFRCAKAPMLSNL